MSVDDSDVFDASELLELERQEARIAAKREAILAKVTPEQKTALRRLEAARQAVDDAISAYDDLAETLGMRTYRESIVKVGATREAPAPVELTEVELGQILGALSPENEGPAIGPSDVAKILNWQNGGRKALVGLTKLKNQGKVIGDNQPGYSQKYSLPAREEPKKPAKKR